MNYLEKRIKERCNSPAFLREQADLWRCECEELKRQIAAKDAALREAKGLIEREIAIWPDAWAVTFSMNSLLNLAKHIDSALPPASEKNAKRTVCSLCGGTGEMAAGSFDVSDLYEEPASDQAEETRES
ncbi:MAG: hypothetical protein ABFD89_01480 [Bryobacteraceae bacterium]